MPTKLEGKIALVTGGSRGIGAAIAKRLAADGANVAITYAKGTDAAASVVKEIEHSGRKAIAIQADAADAKAVKAAVDKTVATFGRLDVLVNNAGTAIPKTFEGTTLEEMDRMIDINIQGCIRRHPSGTKAYEGWWSHYHDRFGGGRTRRVATTCPLFGHERSSQDVYSGVVPRGRESRHYGQQCPAGTDRHGFESGLWRLGGTAKGRHSARPLREG
jgi:hypothetical protein